MAEFFRSLFGAKPAQPNDPGDVRSTFLFTEPSFFSGFGRIYDLWGGFDLYDLSRNVEQADLRAIYADWRVVGQELRDAIHCEAIAS